ncbi:MAG TPA: DUF1800 family protein [Pyrinomonadaceae bacterium]|jgi:uncharacterized protein (DUF1800 family)
MLIKSDACRRLRFFALCGVFCCLLIFGGASVSANVLPEDAPVLISEANSTKALVDVTSGRGRNLSNKIIQPGRQAIVTFFLTNLDLLEGEGANAFRAEFEDAMHFRYPLEIVSFERTATRKNVYALSVRLGDEIVDLGNVLVRVTWRGMSSNRVQISIGHESKIADDEGATPTPLPNGQTNVRKSTENRANLPWTGDRVRFIEQATFGVNSALELRLRRIGYSTWLEEQMDEQIYSAFTYPPMALQQTTPSPTCDGDVSPPDIPATCFRDNYTMYPLQNWFFKEALYNENQQLRRRVSWALSQIFVVSGRTLVQPSRMNPYIQILDANAFGNYRALLRQITLNPAMGTYLDMAISTKQNPNENYAREILQLFSIGLDMLNQDGTPMLDGQGNRIPTYNQETIVNFAKVFTGWSFCTNTCNGSEPGIVNYRDQMISNAANHDTTQKTLMSYPGAETIVPPGQTTEQDLEAALSNIFNHPNVAPFVSKHLIKQLVTSNPTPAYVGRIAAVFNDNGQGTRGDLKSVVRAILLDPEARGNLKTDPDYGKLREPVLFVTNVLRPFNPAANSNIAVPASCNGQSDGVINGITQTLDQDVFNSPNVFNYYHMDYIIPNTPLAGPEFEIFSTGTSLKRPNFVNQMAPANSTGTTGILAVAPTATVPTSTPCGTRIDLTRLQTLAASDATGAALLDTLNREMMHGSMSSAVRNEFLTAIQAVSSANTLKRVRTAFYLVTTLNQYQVQR